MKIIKQFEFLAADMCHRVGNFSSIATCRSCHLDLQRSELQFVDLNFLSVNVAVPK